LDMDMMKDKASMDDMDMDVDMMKDKAELRIMPPAFDVYDQETQGYVMEYIGSLDAIQYKAYLIAMDHLKSSFDLIRSNGYCTFIELKQKKS